MPQEGGRPNQLELETQRTNLMLQETLTNLDRTLSNMQGTRDQLNMGVKLDAILEDLAARNISDKAALREFNQTAAQLQGGLNQALAAQQAEINSRASGIASSLGIVNAQLEEYSPDYAPPATIETMAPDLANTMRMNNEIQRYMYGDPELGIMGQSKALKAAGYMTDPAIASPYFNPSASHQTLMEQELRWYDKLRDVAEHGSAGEMREFMKFERDRHEEVQKAMLNKQISEAFGNRDMINRTEFEAVVQPSLSNFAEDYGMAMDQAAAVIKKMHDLGVISQQVNKGDSMAIMTAIDTTDEIFTKLSKVIKSTDVNELTAYASALTSIGGGDFDRGLNRVRQSTQNIMGGMGDTAQSMAQASAAAQRYSEWFGSNNIRSFNAGAWEAYNANLANDYSSWKPAGSIYSQSVMEQAMGNKGLLLAYGGGADARAGAERLMNIASSQDAADFYLSLGTRRRRAQEKMTGAAADVYMELQIENLQKEYGLSENEALLATFQGNTTKVDAYKEMQRVRQKRADDVQRQFDAMRYMGTYTPGEANIAITRDRSAYSEADVDLTGDIWSEIGLRKLGTDIRKSVERINPEFELTYDKYDFSTLKQAQTRDISTLSGSTRVDKELKDSSTVNTVLSCLETEAAQDRLEKIIKQIQDKGYRPKITDIQEVIIDGLREYTASGLLRDPETQERIKAYVAKLTPDIANTDLAPMLPEDSPMRMLITAVRDFGAVAQDLLTPDQLVRQQMAGSLYESGIDIRGNIAGSETLRDVSQWMREHEGLMTTVGLGVDAALMFTGVGFLASTAISTVIGNLPTIVDAAASAVEYTEAVLGDGIDMTAISDAMGLNDTDVPAMESEIRGFLLLIRSLMSTHQLDKSDKCYAALKSLLRQYVSRLKANGRKAERGVLAPLEDDKELNQLAMTVAAEWWNNWSKAGHKKGGDNDYLDSDVDEDRIRQVTLSIVKTVNSPGSQVGQYLRRNPSGGSLYRTGVSGDDGGDIYRIATKDLHDVLDDKIWTDSDVTSIQNLLKMNPNADISTALIQLTQNKGNLEQIQQQFNNVSESITLSTGSAADKETARKVTDRLTKWIQSGSEEPLDFSNEEIEALNRTVGDGDTLREITRLEDKASAKARMIEWMDKHGSFAAEKVQEAEDRSVKFIRNFTKTAQMLMNNPDASQLSRQLYQHITRGY